MTKRDIAGPAIKLIGIFLLASQIGSLPLVFVNIANVIEVGGPAQGAGRTLAVSIVTSTVAVGVYLWVILRGDAVAAMVVAQDRKIALGDAASIRELQMVAFSAIGLVILVRSVTDLAEMTLTYLAFVSPIPRPIRYPTHVPTQLLTAVVQLALGLYVSLGAPGLVELWSRYATHNR